MGSPVRTIWVGFRITFTVTLAFNTRPKSKAASSIKLHRATMEIFSGVKSTVSEDLKS